jgi:DNA-binding NtrC family response regulator
LAHCIHRALIFTKGYPIQMADLPVDAANDTGRASGLVAWNDRLRELICDYLGEHLGDHAFLEFVEDAERLMIAEALRQTDGNQTHASRLLGLTRPTLHAKMRKFGLFTDAE